MSEIEYTEEDREWDIMKLKKEYLEALADEEDAASRAATALQELEDMGADVGDLL